MTTRVIWRAIQPSIVCVVFAAVSLAGCALFTNPQYWPGVDDALGQSAEVLREVEAYHVFEQQRPNEAHEGYKKILSTTKVDRPFSKYQVKLNDALKKAENDRGETSIEGEATLGFPLSYSRSVLACAKAHQGLARLYLAKGNFVEAEAEIERALHMLKFCEFCPDSMAHARRESHRILAQLYREQRLVGKALLQQLNIDLLNDHLQSETGIDSFYIEKKLLQGEASDKQYRQMTEFRYVIIHHKDTKQTQEMLAQMSGAMQAYSSVQQGLAQQALAQSEGVSTPGVQEAMMNAQVAQLAAVMTQNAIAASAKNQNALDRASTPWALPTFARQLLDPRAGISPQDLIKNFTGEVVKVGGSSYQGGAHQVTQAVDALTPYRQSGKVDGAAAQVEKFAEVFNAFLTQVQEIKK